MNNISDRILYIIESKKISKTEFANTLNITQAYVSKMINKGSIPSDRLKEDICEKFHVNREWLESGTGNPFIEMTPIERAYNRFGNIMENASPSKKATLTMLIELIDRLPDDEWDYIMNQYYEALKEQKK